MEVVEQKTQAEPREAKGKENPTTLGIWPQEEDEGAHEELPEPYEHANPSHAHPGFARHEAHRMCDLDDLIIALDGVGDRGTWGETLKIAAQDGTALRTYRQRLLIGSNDFVKHHEVCLVSLHNPAVLVERKPGPGLSHVAAGQRQTDYHQRHTSADQQSEQSQGIGFVKETGGHNTHLLAC